MVVLFAASVFLSASLLFLIEPMFARLLLPRLGGAPAVWNTCVAFYQLALLAGYGYAHLLATRLRTRVSVAVHLTFLATGAAVLPIAIDPAWAPPSLAQPVPAIFWLLLRALGLPFVALAASGPLLQRWYVLSRPADTNPYWLYAASNTGSLAALLLYPFAIEPSLSLAQQGGLWTAGYVILIALVCGSAYAVNRRRAPEQAIVRPASTADASEDERWAARLEWLALAFAPASLMLGVTSFISTDIAAVPLLWIVPLAAYLVTLILAFADRTFVPALGLELLARLAIVSIVVLALGGNSLLSTPYGIAAHLIAFFVITLACHRRLALRRPPPSELTDYYLWVAAGGAMGGIFNALVAPLLFVTPIEYPLTAIATCLLLPEATPGRRSSRVLTMVTTLVPVVLLVTLTLGVRVIRGAMPDSTALRYVFAAGPALVACLALWRSPVRMGIALATLFLAGSFLQQTSGVTLHLERTFFGVHRVTYNGVARILMNGTTNHGSQAADPAYRCEPLSYYATAGPIGDVMRALRAQHEHVTVAVVGLGTASMGAHARSGDAWTFFEINPAIERLARDPAYFTYLHDCAPAARVVIGDARLSLVNEVDGAFDLIVLDAFSSDAIPVHLLTREALALYLRKLRPDGTVALHISNRYFDLGPVVAAGAAAIDVRAALRAHTPEAGRDPMREEIAASRWAAMSRSHNLLQTLEMTGWERLDPGVAAPVWTDDFSNVLSAIRR